MNYILYVLEVNGNIIIFIINETRLKKGKLISKVEYIKIYLRKMNKIKTNSSQTFSVFR